MDFRHKMYFVVGQMQTGLFCYQLEQHLDYLFIKFAACHKIVLHCAGEILHRGEHNTEKNKNNNNTGTSTTLTASYSISLKKI